MDTATVAEPEHQEIIDARALHASLKGRERIFTVDQIDDGELQVRIRPTSDLLDPTFIHRIHFWGPDRADVLDRAQRYLDLVANQQRCETGISLIKVISQALSRSEEVIDDLKVLASYVRGNGGRRAPSDLHWFIARITELATWNDRVGLETIFDAMKSAPTGMAKTVTGRDGYEWRAALRLETGMG